MENERERKKEIKGGGEIERDRERSRLIEFFKLIFTTKKLIFIAKDIMHHRELQLYLGHLTDFIFPRAHNFISGFVKRNLNF